jgi:hypothetical protein
VDGSLLNQREMAVRWTLYFAIAGALISSPMYLLATFKDPKYAVHSLTLQVLALSCAAVCIVLFAATFEMWVFCGKNFCNYIHSQPLSTTSSCFYAYETGYVMSACGTCMLLVGCTFAVAAMITQKRRENRFALVMTGRNRTQAQPPSDFEAPEGFLFDPSCGLYYSEEAQLYLDPESCHYYDPSSGMWYDTNADLWYEIADE